MNKVDDRKIKSTKNYRLFGRSADNRAVCTKKHKRLFKSMKERGFLPCYPIVCRRDRTKNLIVLDGQHRLAFAETLGLPVFWVETNAASFDVADINAGVVPWALFDYAQKFADQGKQHYKELIAFANLHGLSIGYAGQMLAGVVSWSVVKERFLDGNFEVKDRAFADIVASTFNAMARINVRVRNMRLLGALMGACRAPEFNPDRLISNAQRCRERVEPYSTTEAYLSMLEDIYNFGRAKLYGLKSAAQMAMRERNPRTATRMAV